MNQKLPIIMNNFHFPKKFNKGWITRTTPTLKLKNPDCPCFRLYGPVIIFIGFHHWRHRRNPVYALILFVYMCTNFNKKCTFIKWIKNKMISGGIPFLWFGCFGEGSFHDKRKYFGTTRVVIDIPFEGFSLIKFYGCIRWHEWKTKRLLNVIDFLLLSDGFLIIKVIFTAFLFPFHRQNRICETCVSLKHQERLKCLFMYWWHSSICVGINRSNFVQFMCLFGIWYGFVCKVII